MRLLISNLWFKKCTNPNSSSVFLIKMETANRGTSAFLYLYKMLESNVVFLPNEFEGEKEETAYFRFSFYCLTKRKKCFKNKLCYQFSSSTRIMLIHYKKLSINHYSTANLGQDNDLVKGCSESQPIYLFISHLS